MFNVEYGFLASSNFGSFSAQTPLLQRTNLIRDWSLANGDQQPMNRMLKNNLQNVRQKQ